MSSLGNGINRKSWTKKEDDYIKKHYKNTDVSVLAKELKRTRNAVRIRAQKLGIKKRKHWTNEEDIYVDKNYEYTPKEEMMKHLKRDWRSIKSRAEILGVNRGNNIYSVYKGDKLVITGTAEECAEFMDVQPTYIRQMTAPSRVKEQKQKRNRDTVTTVVKVESAS